MNTPETLRRYAELLESGQTTETLEAFTKRIGTIEGLGNSYESIKNLITAVQESSEASLTEDQYNEIVKSLSPFRPKVERKKRRTKAQLLAAIEQNAVDANAAGDTSEAINTFDALSAADQVVSVESTSDEPELVESGGKKKR